MTEFNAMKKDETKPALMDENTFKHLRDLIYEQTGIHFQENKKYLLESRLQPRLRARQCRTFGGAARQPPRRRRNRESGEFPAPRGITPWIATPQLLPKWP